MDDKIQISRPGKYDEEVARAILAGFGSTNRDLTFDFNTMFKVVNPTVDLTDMPLRKTLEDQKEVWAERTLRVKLIG